MAAFFQDGSMTISQYKLPVFIVEKYQSRGELLRLAKINVLGVFYPENYKNKETFATATKGPKLN